VTHEEGPALTRDLPAIFHEQATSPESPLAAILQIGQELFDGLDEAVDAIPFFFDVETAPTATGRDFLSWLASWVDLDLVESWPDGKRRRLVGIAAELYTSRGTVPGLRRMIAELHEIDVDIEEWAWPEGMVIGRRSGIGVNTRLLEAPDLDRCFQVRWRPVHQPSDELVRRVRALIDREKPAHTKSFLLIDMGEPEGRELSALVIGESSVLGQFYVA
jgi:phage tail-like protein